MKDDQEGRTRGRNKRYLRVRTAIPLLSKFYRARRASIQEHTPAGRVKVCRLQALILTKAQGCNGHLGHRENKTRVSKRSSRTCGYALFGVRK